MNYEGQNGSVVCVLYDYGVGGFYSWIERLILFVFVFGFGFFFCWSSICLYRILGIVNVPTLEVLVSGTTEEYCWY